MADPPIVCADPPLKVTAKFPLRLPVPFTVQLPATEIFPAKVAATPVLMVTCPNVIAAVGVIVPVPVKTAVLAALSVVSAVVTFVKPFAKLTVEPETVENTGLSAPPKINEVVVGPLKLMVPVLVAESVPDAIVRSLLKVITPVLTVITLFAARVFAAIIRAPVTVNEPVVIAIFAT